MNITLMTFGTRGDVQPFLALAVALRDRGHNVTLAAPSDFEVQVNAYNIPFIRMPINSMEFVQKDRSKQVAGRITPMTVLAFWREVLPELKRAFHTATQEVAEAAHN